MGIVFSPGRIQQNDDKHRAIWWLSKYTVSSMRIFIIYMLDLLSYSKASVAASKLNKLPVLPCPEHVHVATCLKKVLEWKSNNSWPSLEDVSPCIQVLYRACLTIPFSDKLIMPLLKSHFMKPHITVANHNPISFTNYSDYLAAALATNFAFTAPIEKSRSPMQTTLFPGLVHSSMPRIKNSMVQLQGVYHPILSAYLYVPPSEKITVHIPQGLVNKGCKLQIGCHTDPILDFRERNLVRFPSISCIYDINYQQMDIGNPFGGLLYISIPKTVFTSLSKEMDMKIERAVSAPVFLLGTTSVEQWRGVEQTKLVPFTEWVGKHISITIPSRSAALVDDPSVPLKFWDNVIQVICSLLHVTVEHQRIVFDVQLTTGNSRAGYPCMFTYGLIDAVINPCAEVLLKDGSVVIHELCHSVMTNEHTSFLWKGRQEPIVNVLTYYVYEKVFDLKMEESSFYVDMCATVKSHLLNSEMNPQGKYMLYRNDSSGLSTMLELILIKQFGWQPLDQLWGEYMSKPIMVMRTDQEKLEDWIVRYSELVQHDVRPYFESWGIPLSKAKHANISKLPQWTFA